MKFLPILPHPLGWYRLVCHVPLGWNEKQAGKKDRKLLTATVGYMLTNAFYAFGSR
jgi:hypothetical protein